MDSWWGRLSIDQLILCNMHATTILTMLLAITTMIVALATLLSYGLNYQDLNWDQHLRQSRRDCVVHSINDQVSNEQWSIVSIIADQTPVYDVILRQQQGVGYQLVNLSSRTPIEQLRRKVPLAPQVHQCYVYNQAYYLDYQPNVVVTNIRNLEASTYTIAGLALLSMTIWVHQHYWTARNLDRGALSSSESQGALSSSPFESESDIEISITSDPEDNHDIGYDSDGYVDASDVDNSFYHKKERGLD